MFKPSSDLAEELRWLLRYWYKKDGHFTFIHESNIIAEIPIVIRIYAYEDKSKTYTRKTDKGLIMAIFVNELGERVRNSMIYGRV